MDFKLVATATVGKYHIGDEVTDAGEMEKLLAGSLRKKFIRAAIHPGDAPVIDAPAAAPEPMTEPASFVPRALGDDQSEH